MSIEKLKNLKEFIKILRNIRVEVEVKNRDNLMGKKELAMI